MTSLGETAYVGELHYNSLVPPVMVGVDNLQDTCDIGNTTTTDIFMSGASANLRLSGATAPKITFGAEDVRIVKSVELKNISIGFDVGTALDNQTIEIGNNITNGGGQCVNIGNDIATGPTAQGKFSVAIGKGAGGSGMGSSCIAIGTDAGSINQGTGTIPPVDSIAIGSSAGADEQGSSSIAIGAAAGQADQKIESIAIGKNAGKARQQRGSIAIGFGAAASRQQTNSIAIGYDCCPDTQGSDAIAIGTFGIGFPSGAVGINAGGVALTPATVGCFINPIAGGTNPAGGVANSLWYDTTTKEVKYHIP